LPDGSEPLQSHITDGIKRVLAKYGLRAKGRGWDAGGSRRGPAVAESGAFLYWSSVRPRT